LAQPAQLATDKQQQPYFGSAPVTAQQRLSAFQLSTNNDFEIIIIIAQSFFQPNKRTYSFNISTGLTEQWLIKLFNFFSSLSAQLLSFSSAGCFLTV
jgi:hypothetical protein